MTKYMYLALGLTALCLTGCASMEAFMAAAGPLIDTAVKIGVDSVAGTIANLVVENTGKLGDEMAKQWTGGEITTAITGVLLGTAATVKAATMAWNRDPNKVKA